MGVNEDHEYGSDLSGHALASLQLLLTIVEEKLHRHSILIDHTMARLGRYEQTRNRDDTVAMYPVSRYPA